MNRIIPFAQLQAPAGQATSTAPVAARKAMAEKQQQQQAHNPFFQGDAFQNRQAPKQQQVSFQSAKLPGNGGLIDTRFSGAPAAPARKGLADMLPLLFAGDGVLNKVAQLFSRTPETRIDSTGQKPLSLRDRTFYA
jgi:hypothetical protein